MKKINANVVKEVVGIDALIEYYRPEPQSKKLGNSTQFLCPFHDDKNLGACFSISGSEYFQCQSCGAKGDFWTLAEGFTGISDFRKLVQNVCTIFNVSEAESEEDFIADKKQKGPQITGQDYIALIGQDKISYEGNEHTYLVHVRKKDSVYHDDYVLKIASAKYDRQAKLLTSLNDYSSENELLMKIKEALSVAEIKKTPKEFVEETIEREKNLLRKILVDPQKYEEEITRRERKGISLKAILKAIKV